MYLLHQLWLTAQIPAQKVRVIMLKLRHRVLRYGKEWCHGMVKPGGRSAAAADERMTTAQWEKWIREIHEGKRRLLGTVVLLLLLRMTGR